MALIFLLDGGMEVATLPSAKELIEVNPYGVAVYGTLVALLVSAVIYLAKQLQASHARETDISAKFVEIMRQVATDKSRSDADKVTEKVSEYHNDLKNTMSQNKTDLITTITNGFNNINRTR